MPDMISLRSFLLSSTKGHMVQFEANVARWVPEAVVQEAMNAGCVPTDKASIPFYEDVTRAQVDFQGDARRSTIYLAVKAIAEANNHADFTAGGVPKHEVVAERLGYTVSRDEVNAVYKQYLGAKSENRDYQLHPQAENILRVIEATSKKELIELGEEFGVAAELMKGLTVRDLRRTLLVKFNGITAD